MYFCNCLYRYHQSASGTLYYTRTVNISDLYYVAGVPEDTKLTDFDKEDTASFDSKKTLQRAQGRMHVSLASLSPSGNKPRYMHTTHMYSHTCTYIHALIV